MEIKMGEKGKREMHLILDLGFWFAFHFD